MRTAIVLCLILLTRMAQAVPAAKDLLGTWLTVSHITVTVTHYKEDGTFSGTYFTPVADVKTTFSGKWILLKDELVLTYLESSSPVMKVPLEDRNRLAIKDKDTIVFQTLPSGMRLEVSRVKFKDPKEVDPGRQKQVR